MSPLILLVTVFLSVFFDVWAASLVWKEPSLSPSWGFAIVLLMPLSGVGMLVAFNVLRNLVSPTELLVIILYSSCVFLFGGTLAVTSLTIKHYKQKSSKLA